jgi:hypothetical protein
LEVGEYREGRKSVRNTEHRICPGVGVGGDGTKESWRELRMEIVVVGGEL